MIDVDKIERDVAVLDDMKGEEKLQAARKAYLAVSLAEQECARDFTVPFQVVKKVRELIPVVQATVNRLEAGARKRETNKAANG